MRLHERTQHVAIARSALKLQVLGFQQEHDLTDAEMAIALQDIQDMFLRGVLRAERHPEDPSRKADEE